MLDTVQIPREIPQRWGVPLVRAVVGMLSFLTISEWTMMDVKTAKKKSNTHPVSICWLTMYITQSSIQLQQTLLCVIVFLHCTSKFTHNIRDCSNIYCAFIFYTVYKNFQTQGNFAFDMLTVHTHKTGNGSTVQNSTDMHDQIQNHKTLWSWYSWDHVEMSVSACTTIHTCMPDFHIADSFMSPFQTYCD